MEQFSKKYPFLTPRNLAWIGLMLAMVGLSWSNALLSIGTVTMILPGFVAAKPRDLLRRFWLNKPAVLLALIIPVHLFAFFWTQSPEAWLRDFNVKAPLLFLLFSLSVLPKFSKKQIQASFLVMLVGTAFFGFITTINYLFHQEEINELVRQSVEIRVFGGRSHLYFSIIGGISVWSGIWLTFRLTDPLFKGQNWLTGLLTVMVFMQMHVLAARTGLVAMYASFGIVGLVSLGRDRRWLLVGFLLAGLVAVPLLAYQFVPSLQRRIENTSDDVDRYLYDDYINFYSISMRLEALETAWDLFGQKPLIGVGLADLGDRMEEQYILNDSSLFEENRVLPHNQFIEYLAGLGLLGFLIFTIGYFAPLFFASHRNSLLFISVWIILLFAMQAESILERQVGVFLTAFFWGAIGRMGAPET